MSEKYINTCLPEESIISTSSSVPEPYSSDEEFRTMFFAHLSQNFLSEKRVAEVKSERHSELKVVGIDQCQHISDEAPIISFVPNTEMTISKYLEKIRALFDDISARKLEKRVELPGKIAKYTFAFNKPVEISEDERKIIYSVAEKQKSTLRKIFSSLETYHRVAYQQV